MAGAAVTGLIGLWAVMTERERRASEKSAITRLPASATAKGIHFHDTFILNVTDSGIKVLSNRCTHAGCRISRESEGKLVCPCHGSEFDPLNGKVLRGPALKPLPEIPFSHSPATGEIIIQA
jgi:cytochrome b6-f complex iron-sulfur subunit